MALRLNMSKFTVLKKYLKQKKRVELNIAKTVWPK
jgi:hypothetical protein